MSPVGPTSLRKTVGSVLRNRPSYAGAALAGSIMHAAGHAFLAGAAGMLARTLAEGSTRLPMDVGSTSPAVLLALAGVFAAVVKLAGSALSSWAEARIASDVGNIVRLAVLDRVLALDGRPNSGSQNAGSQNAGAPDTKTWVGGGGVGGEAPDEERNERAERLTALTSHVHDVERGVGQGVVAEVRAVVALAPLGVLLILLAPRLAGSAVVALAGFGVLAFSLRRAFKRAHARASASAGALVGAADEAVRHAELWATYGASRRIRAHVAGIGRAIAQESAAVRVRAALLSSTSEVLGALALALVLLLAARGLLGVDRGTVVPFAIVFFMAYKPLRDLVEARIERARGEEALRASLFNTGALPPNPHPPRPDFWAGAPGAAAIPAPRPRRAAWGPAALVLDGVATAHGTHAPISITIPAGAIVAVVGPTGIGKTSLVRALLGLAPVRAGCIHWGDASIEGAGVGPVERPFAWVPQDAPVVGDTLAINVGLGRADDDAQVTDPAPFLAQLGAPFLPEDVTNRPLSGGERQWICVARALASGQPALLLDEPTSALDAASEERLLAALVRLRGARTVIIVTHRPAPLAIADVVLDLDRVAEQRGRDARREKDAALRAQ